MSFFGNQSVAGTQPSIHHFRVNASQYGSIIPIVYGRARIPGIFIWSGDFTASKGKGAGKGMGGTGGSFYTYSISVEIALAQGPIGSIGRSWHMASGGLKRHTAAQTNSNWTVFRGSFGQAAWSYLTSRHPGQDLGYTGIALLARSAWNLGTAGSPPQITFEVFGLKPFGSGVPDSNPADIFTDILTNSQYGLGLSSGYIADLTDFSNYCIANGYFISPVFDQQKSASEWLRLLLDCVHADAVWSNGCLKIVPYGDQPATGNGVTWVPGVGPVYVLTDDDFMAEKNAAPVTMTVTTPSDRANVVDIEYVNAANDYNLETAEAKDEADIQRLGQRRDSPKQFHPITNALMARTIAQVKLQRSLYVANQYQVRVPQRYILAEPMDVVGLTDSYLGLSAYPARITEIQEEADDAGMVTGDSLLITLEDVGQNSTPGYPTQPPGPWGSVDQNTTPNAVNTNPLIFEPPAKALGNHPIGAHLKGSLELWVAASAQNADTDWGGCNVYLSSDNSTYNLIGRIRNAAAMGTLIAGLPSHADPDTTDTLQVDLSQSGGSLTAVSHALADRGMNLAYVDGELICFGDVAAGSGPNQFNLGYLRRGRYGTSSTTHASGSTFAFLGAIHALDSAVLRIPLTNAQIGQTLYLKFASVNTEVDSEQDLSTCTAYSLAVAGVGHQNRVPPRYVKKYKVTTAYSAGAYVKPNAPNGFFYQAVNSGTTGGSEPAWPLGVDESVTDSGGVTWIAVESSPELDPGSIGTATLDDTPLPDPAAPSWVISKKGDLKLAWSYVVPRPSNFSHFEIRSGASWAAGSFIDTTKRTNYLVTDPPPGTTTYWIGAINVALLADVSPLQITATMPSVAPVTGLTATVTKKQDLKLTWVKPSPFPAHFRAYEIRTDTNPGNATNLVDHTKRTTYLITDPTGGATYYLYVLDEAGNYSAGVSVTATTGAPYKKSWLQEWSGFVADSTDNNRYSPPQGSNPNVATPASTSANYGGDWEISFQFELSTAASFLDLYHGDGSGGGFGHAYLFEIASSGLTHSIYRWNGGSFSPLGQVTSGVGTGGAHNAIVKRHGTGHLELYIDGANVLTVQDTTYGGGGPFGMLWASAVAYVSNVVVRGGHADTPKAYKDPGTKRALVDFTHAHVNKHLGNVADDTTSGTGRRKAHAVDAIANRPASTGSNALFHATDQGRRGKTWRDDPTAGWVQVGHGNLDDAEEGTTYNRTLAVAQTSNVPKKSWLKAWSGMTVDTTDGNRHLPQNAGAPSAGTLTVATYGADWEIQVQFEVTSSASVLDIGQGDGSTSPSGLGHGYVAEIQANGVSGFYRWDGSYHGLATAPTSLAVGAHGAIFKRHATGHFELYVDGVLVAQVQDTTYGGNSPIYMAWVGAAVYVSNVTIRAGHYDTPAAHKDAASKSQKKESAHLWNGLTTDPTNVKRMYPQHSGTPNAGTMTTAVYGGDWEVSIQFEVTASNSILDLGQGDGTTSPSGLGHGYVWEIQASGVSGLYKWDGAFHGLGTASTSLATGLHGAIFKRHSTGHLELYVDGALVVQVQDATYGGHSGIYLAWNGSIVYLSAVTIRAGHADVPKDYLDTSKKLTKKGISSKTISNDLIAAGAVTQGGSNSATPNYLTPNWGTSSYSPWYSLVTTNLTVQNNGDIVEASIVIIAVLNGYSAGDDVEVQIMNDLGTAVATPQLAIAPDITRVNGATDPSSLPVGVGGTLTKALVGNVFFQEFSAGARAYTLRIRGWHNVTDNTSSIVYYYAQLSMIDFGA